MKTFNHPPLRLGVAYTRRDTWMNKETEQNRERIRERLLGIFESEEISVFSNDALGSVRKRILINGREVLTSNNGFLSDYEDAVNLAQYFKDNRVDALFVPFCNYGQEDAVAKLAKELGVPTLIWGPRDEPPVTNSIYRATDTQCGIFAAAKVLRRYGIPFTYIENCWLDDDSFTTGLKEFLTTARIVNSFRRGRVAQISVRPQQFTSLMVNEGELLERFGIEIVPITGIELIDTIKHIQRKESQSVSDLVHEIEQSVDLSALPDKNVMGAIELGFMRIAERYGCNAIASDCWHTVRREFGIGPWFVFGDLYDRGLPCTNECDIHGAITSLLAIGALNNKSAAFLTDLTMRHPTDDSSELLWHMGFAKQLMDKQSHAYVAPSGEGMYRLKPGEVTILRFDGDHGEYFCFVGTGSSTFGPPTGGNYTYLTVDNWSKWENKFVKGPYVHHVVGMYGNFKSEINNALTYLGVIKDSPEKDLFVN